MNTINMGYVGPRSGNSRQEAVHRGTGKNVSNSGRVRETTASEASEAPDVNQYLTLVSRMENRVKNNSLSDGDMNKILGSLENKINSLSEKSRERVYKLKEFQDMQLEQGRELKKQLKKKMRDEEDKLFAFLRSKEFMKILKDEPDAGTYSKVS